MKEVIDWIRTTMRTGLRHVARWIDRISGGRVSPSAVTIFGVLMHLPIAIMIARGRFLVAAILLFIFGLFDTLDGELARLQKKASPRGMLLDASTDRMKEVMLYSGAAYFFTTSGYPQTATWAVVACGASLTVSYVKAKGEAAIASSSLIIPHAVLNRLFADGILAFELRMFVLWLGLLTGQLFFAVASIAILASITALQRLITISATLEKK